MTAIAQETTGQIPPVLRGLPSLFTLYELNPVAPKAQKKVPIPEGLDLDAWINEPLPDLVEDSESDTGSLDAVQSARDASVRKKKKHRTHDSDEDEEEREKVSGRSAVWRDVRAN